MADMRDSLGEFGADPSALLLLDDPRPELLPYVTLMTARQNRDPTLGIVEAVYEWQGEPLIFLVDADSLRNDKNDNHLKRIRRLLAMRGDAPYLGVVAPGSLRVYRIALDRKSLQQAQVNWKDGDDTHLTVFARLGNERPQAAITNRNWISDIVLKLFDGSMTKLIDLNVSHEDAISLVGRALFTRFLADRDLLPEDKSETSACLFDTHEIAKDTSDWLDDKFNGDLLPLSDDIFESLPAQAYRVLGDVLRRAEEGQLSLGWELRWDNLHFAQIPIGVLSQAYELYLRKHAPGKQKKEGGYFTPRPVADLMVRASFRALEREDAGKTAKVLDPAVGGGIFLLTAFRELVAQHWRADGARPDTDTLRRILYEQIVGFDINEAALRFSALGLYLLSIELDPEPRPVDKLRFEELRNRVLYRVKGTEEDEGKALGSLGPSVGNDHNGQYDLVIGNPPWASATHLPEWKHVCATVSRIAADRKIADPAPPLPNEVLDLPFVWRAMEWAKPNGQIAFALHARLLFAQGDGMPIARRALFEALDVTSVVNGAELRQTKVWPRVSAPFCILFGTNRTPGVEAGFRFISPRVENSLNEAGAMRIDSMNAEVVASRKLVYTPDILKILFRGSKADLGILERIRNDGHPTLYDFWSKKIGLADQRRLLGSGNGYQKLRESSRVRQRGDGLPGVDASYLYGRPEITAAPFRDIVIDSTLLNLFSHKRIHDRRSMDLFAGPQTIIHQSPSTLGERISVAITDEGIVFNTTFHGYCPGTNPDAALLVRYLALIIGSRFTMWFSLITSGQFGVERDVVEKVILDRIPLPNFDNFTPQQREEIKHLVAGLQSGEVSWEEVDAWVVRLYGLSQRDLQVIRDTLEFNLPFPKNKQKAQAPPTSAEREQFCKALRNELEPWCNRFDSRLTVDRIPAPTMSPWQAIAIRTSRGETAETIPADDWIGLMKAADDAAASEIIIGNGPGELLVARLAQRRYWSETQARLLAQHVVWSYLELLKRHVDV